MVKSVAECYHALGIVHQIWRHIPHQFDDYITNPKANGYRSLHTAVIAENKSLEIQSVPKKCMKKQSWVYVRISTIKTGSKTTDYSFNHRLHSLRAVLAHYQERTETSAHPNEDETEDFEQIKT